MKISFDSPILGIDRNPVQQDGKVVIQRELISGALLSPKAEQTGLEKLKLFKLASLIYEGGELDLSAEDLVLIKEYVGNNLTTLAAGQILELIEK